jgi:Mrp family chromosome partitioning ATPase
MRQLNVNAGQIAGRNGRLRIKRQGVEPYDDLLWRLQARQTAPSMAITVGLLGCEPRAGVTTVAANLALRASERGLGPVLLVETAQERPKLTGAWKLPGGPGLVELLSGEASFSECLHQGPAADLHVIAAGGGKRHDAPMWDAGAIDALIAEACADHHLVLFDLPSASRLQHAVLLARQLDQVLLVVRAENTRDAVARRAAELLQADGVRLAGVVLNRRRSYVPRWLSRWI